MVWIVLIRVLDLLKWLIFIRVIMSWFVPAHSTNPLVRIIYRITDPILRPLSEMMPPLGGLDLSPILAFVAIHLFQQLFLRLAY